MPETLKKAWAGVTRAGSRLTARKPERGSVVGTLLQLVGAAAVLYGLYTVYAPLAFLAGGVVALIVGEQL